MCLFNKNYKIVPYKQYYLLDVFFYSDTHRKIIEDIYVGDIRYRKGSQTTFYFSGKYYSDRLIVSLKTVADGLGDNSSYSVSNLYVQ